MKIFFYQKNEDDQFIEYVEKANALTRVCIPFEKACEFIHQYLENIMLTNVVSEIWIMDHNNYPLSKCLGEHFKNIPTYYVDDYFTHMDNIRSGHHWEVMLDIKKIISKQAEENKIAHFFINNLCCHSCCEDFLSDVDMLLSNFDNVEIALYFNMTEKIETRKSHQLALLL